jgi:hypothetical protein
MSIFSALVSLAMTSVESEAWPLYDELGDWGEAPPTAISCDAPVVSTSPPAKKKWVVNRRRDLARPIVDFDPHDPDFLPEDPKIVRLDLAIEYGLEVARKHLHDHPDDVAELDTVLLTNATGLQIATALFKKFYTFFYRSEFDGTVFDTHVARRVVAVPIGNEQNLNLFFIVARFLQISEEFRGADFGYATFGAIPAHPKKDKFDRDYDISHHVGQRTLSESLFTDLFKAFRSIVSRGVCRVTKSYKTPDLSKAGTWKYTVKVDGERVERQSDDFVRYMRDYVPLFVEMEKLSKPLTEVFSIFEGMKKITEEKEEEDE